MKILIAGDFAPMARLSELMDERRLPAVFPEELRDVVCVADFSLVNFESPVVEGDFKPIHKCGPNLKCTKEAAEAVKYAGFTGVTLANNHILDYGAEGLHRTVECCRNQGLDVVGVGDNLEDAMEILYLEKKEETLAVINCCEHEFSIATGTEAGANPLEPVRQFYQIREARDKADHVLVIVHGGHEHFRLPSPRMVETYHFFIDAGADAVVNHHQHCYSGYETRNGKPIFYGLGNFCFDEDSFRNCFWNRGYMVGLDFSDGAVGFALYPYSQCDGSASVDLLHGDELNNFEKDLDVLNHIIGDKALLKERLRTYYEKCSEGELSILEPYGSRVTRKLYSLGLLPSFIRGRKLAAVLNHVDCESHRDKMLFALNQKNK